MNPLVLLQLCDCDQDETLDELAGFRLAPCPNPDLLQGFMGLPPVPVVEQVDAVEVVPVWIVVPEESVTACSNLWFLSRFLGNRAITRPSKRAG